jgi:hypothetical protein
VADHAGDGQADLRTAFVGVVLAAVVVGIAANGVASHDVEGKGLARQARRGGQCDGASHALREACGPGQYLVASDRAADDRQQLFDAEMIQQSALHLNHVANGDGWKIAAVRPSGRRVEAAGSRRAATPAEEVRADHEVLVGIDRLAGTDHDVPPARIILGVVSGHVGVAAEGMAEEDGVVLRGAERAVGFVGDRHTRQPPAEFQLEGFLEGGRLQIAQRLGVPPAVAVEESVSHVCMLLPRGARAIAEGSAGTVPAQVAPSEL